MSFDDSPSFHDIAAQLEVALSKELWESAFALLQKVPPVHRSNPQVFRMFEAVFDQLEVNNMHKAVGEKWLKAADAKDLIVRSTSTPPTY